MVFDDCTDYPSTLSEAKKSMELTHRWALESKKYFDQHSKQHLLFGIVQGSEYPELRLKSLEYLTSLNFDGIAIGGLSVGEPREKKTKILQILAPELPTHIPHYVMGVALLKSWLRVLGMELICLIVLFQLEMGEMGIFTQRREY